MTPPRLDPPPHDDAVALFSARLRELRVARIGSQDAMAARTGFSRGAIQLWEGSETKPGTLPKGASLIVLADVLGVSTDYLLGQTDDPRRPRPRPAPPGPRPLARDHGPTDHPRPQGGDDALLDLTADRETSERVA